MQVQVHLGRCWHQPNLCEAQTSLELGYLDLCVLRTEGQGLGDSPHYLLRLQLHLGGYFDNRCLTSNLGIQQFPLQAPHFLLQLAVFLHQLSAVTAVTLLREMVHHDRLLDGWTGLSAFTRCRLTQYQNFATGWVWN